MDNLFFNHDGHTCSCGQGIGELGDEIVTPRIPRSEVRPIRVSPVGIFLDRLFAYLGFESVRTT